MLKNAANRVEVYGSLSSAVRSLLDLVDAGLSAHRIMDDSELKDHDSQIYKAAFAVHKLLGELLDENGPAMKGLSAAVPFCQSPAGKRLLERETEAERAMHPAPAENPFYSAAQRQGLLPANAE